ncbi:hypothetical protein AA23498_0872 [Acetobacter nitrogenifigens DSM 23921 = NBRC 105050]|uniref:hypothetical protein n=1 Tax=Acetobacter nitrogenifigens TaxID=285268 RepID=UPI0004080902|nr:hypothetical protein [Acetobacter nitrogenifigens]GBQ90406.1 hypothetical protein AA23498_0872 [Acetobacter nitrogenifigens DSM 23921 = NBRC 105050]
MKDSPDANALAETLLREHGFSALDVADRQARHELHVSNVPAAELWVAALRILCQDTRALKVASNERDNPEPPPSKND